MEPVLAAILALIVGLVVGWFVSLARSTARFSPVVVKAEAERSRLAAELASERAASAEKLALLRGAKDELSDRFKHLAAEILDEKSRRFAEQNRDGLNQLLEPLRTKLGEFQARVEATHLQGTKDRSALAEQVRHLTELNQTLSQEAHALTRALKGSAKVQGNFGELILDQALELSGLRKGIEYFAQESFDAADGGRLQPDVVVRLPSDRALVIDAKVSLTAYEEHLSAESDAARQVALKRHLDSLRGHLKSLGEKDYPALLGDRSPDFVLMFVAIEPAFMLAVTHDRELFADAWKRNVLLVSPSTLLFAVRTVAQLWRQEAQQRNVAEIAKRGAELYDRLVGFVAELDELGKRLGQAQSAYDDARAKLATGKGNVIRQAEMLKELGVKPTKELPLALVDADGRR